MIKGQSVSFGCIGERSVIRNNTRNIATKFAGLPPEDKIVETMIEFRDQHREFRTMRRMSQSRDHPQRGRELFKLRFYFIKIGFRLTPLDPLEKNLFLLIVMLVGVNDISAPLKNPAGNPRNNTGTVGSREERDHCFTAGATHFGAAGCPS